MKLTNWNVSLLFHFINDLLLESNPRRSAQEHALRRIVTVRFNLFFFLMQCVLPFTCVIYFLILFVFSTFYSVREVLWDWTLWMSWWGTLWWSWCLLYGPWQLRWGKWYNIIQECKYLTVFDHLRYANQKVHYLPSAICFSVLGRYD